ncbi:hypothetical protein [Algoriphagus sp. Y33]|uniref:hypothetical protein n=1 Tax=Algoriphagus sp. Y33 TaxID=2772483 RepID=UPI0017817AE6|nr:hypothetical protein [Algoriphagus sp. Y33]
MKYYEVHVIYNVAKIKYDSGFDEQDLIMGAQIPEVQDLSSYNIHTQVVSARGKLLDIYKPSSNLSMRVILSDRAKLLLESYRKGNIRFYPCPILRGKERVLDYWITDIVIFDDEWVDIPRSTFFFKKRKLIGSEDETPRKYEKTEQIIQFNDLFELKEFKEKEMWYMDELRPYRILIKEGCPHHILSIYTTAPRCLIVSEELKNELQKQKMDKGLEFKPLEISGPEWYGPNGLRQQYYK